MEAISRTKRAAVLADCDAGMGTLAVSVKYQVSTAWVRRLKQRRRETEVLSEVVGDGELKKAACLGEIGVAQHPFCPGAHRHVRSYQEVDRFSRV